MFFLKLKKLAVLVLFVGLVAGFSQAQAMSGDNKGYNNFKTMDKDHNNALSWDEVKVHYPQMEEKSFHNIDGNKDNHVSRDEWKTHLDTSKEHMNESKAHKSGM